MQLLCLIITYQFQMVQLCSVYLIMKVNRVSKTFLEDFKKLLKFKWFWHWGTSDSVIKIFIWRVHSLRFLNKKMELFESYGAVMFTNTNNYFKRREKYLSDLTASHMQGKNAPASGEWVVTASKDCPCNRKGARCGRDERVHGLAALGSADAWLRSSLTLCL